MKNLICNIEGVETICGDSINSDSYSLCGNDTSGDDQNEIMPAIATGKPINCPACIDIILHCRKLKFRSTK